MGLDCRRVMWLEVPVNDLVPAGAAMVGAVVDVLRRQDGQT